MKDPVKGMVQWAGWSSGGVGLVQWAGWSSGGGLVQFGGSTWALVGRPVSYHTRPDSGSLASGRRREGMVQWQPHRWSSERQAGPVKGKLVQ